MFPVDDQSVKFHTQLVAAAPVDVFVNCTASGARPDVRLVTPAVAFEVKLATGAVVPPVTVMYPVFRVLLYPPELYVCSAT